MLRRRLMVSSGPENGGGNDDNCITLLHFDNAITNASAVSQTWVKSSYAAYSSSIKKFGTHAIYDSYRDSGSVVALIATNTSSIFYSYLSGDWTLEAWVYLPSNYTNSSYPSGIFNIQANSAGYPYLDLSLHSAGFSLVHSTNGTSLDFQQEYVHAISTLTWHHVALVKKDGYITIYLDGIAQDSNIPWAYTPNASYNINRVGAGCFAYIDEFRFSNIARWTENFTPPTAPY